jgi:glycosyltransferase involved in cell wall biosynthesis
MNKLISICIPCRNEVDNVQPLAEEIIKHIELLPQYDFEIIFIDNCSNDGTQNKLRQICAKEKRIKTILNANNFPRGSGWHAMLQAHGDCIITIPADFQVPVELLPQMIQEWENGVAVVALVKKPGKHDKYRFFRNLYYKISGMLSNQVILPGFTGSGLYNKSFIDVCKDLNDPLFSFQYMIKNYAESVVKLFYNEKSRRSGKSKNSFNSLIHIAIIRFIHVSDILPHLTIITGLIMGIISFFVSIYYFIRKLLDWHNFPIGIAPLIIGMFFLGAIQLIFLGFIGEYIIAIGERQKNKPLVIEKERINFDNNSVEQ